MSADWNLLPNDAVCIIDSFKDRRLRIYCTFQFWVYRWFHGHELDVYFTAYPSPLRVLAEYTWYYSYPQIEQGLIILYDCVDGLGAGVTFRH